MEGAFVSYDACDCSNRSTNCNNRFVSMGCIQDKCLLDHLKTNFTWLSSEVSL